MQETITSPLHSIQRQLKRPRRSSRRGAETVEFALTVPLLFLCFFAGLEFSRAIVVRNNIQSAAMTGARTGILPGATRADCEQAAQDVLDAAFIKQAIVTVTPQTITSSTESVSVTIDVPLAANALPMSRFVQGSTLSQTITLRRENQAK
jgi:Flp pilus assembly protein TadG